MQPSCLFLGGNYAHASLGCPAHRINAEEEMRVLSTIIARQRIRFLTRLRLRLTALGWARESRGHESTCICVGEASEGIVIVI
jgi:hypothetical protein